MKLVNGALIVFVFLMSSGAYVSCINAAEIKPTTTDKDAIVKAIKQYSNITDADVNQYKALRFGGIGTLGAFIVGATSAAGAGAGAYEKAGAIKGMVQDRAAHWMTNPWVLAGLGSAGAAFLSYKLFYPAAREEIERNMLDKVNGFVYVCGTLKRQTKLFDGSESPYTIVNWNFTHLAELRNYLPAGWPVGSKNADIMVYWALKNLVEQGENAQLLLNDIQSLETDFGALRGEIESYTRCLQNNLQLYTPVISKEAKKEIQEIDLAAKKEALELMRAGKYALYGSMLKGAVSSVWNGIKELYAHPEILGLLGLGWVTTKYLVPSIKDVSQGTWDTLRSLKK